MAKSTNNKANIHMNRKQNNCPKRGNCVVEAPHHDNVQFLWRGGGGYLNFKSIRNNDEPEIRELGEKMKRETPLLRR